MPTTLTGSNANWLSKQPTAQPLWKPKRSFWPRVLSSCPMCSVTLVVLPSVTLNGWRTSITSDQEECKENGKKRPEKIFWKLSLKPPASTQNKLTRNSCLKVPRKEISSMQVWKKLWAQLLLRSSILLKRKNLTWEWPPTSTVLEKSTNSILLQESTVANDCFLDIFCS